MREKFFFFLKWILINDSPSSAKNFHGTNVSTLRSLESYYNNTKATKKEDISVSRDAPASKRGTFAAVLADPKVQEAVVDKGIEVAGKLVDKQLQIIDDAQQKAADFLKKEVSIKKLLCNSAREKA